MSIKTIYLKFCIIIIVVVVVVVVVVVIIIIIIIIDPTIQSGLIDEHEVYQVPSKNIYIFRSINKITVY
jgi:hypothetical protein